MLERTERARQPRPRTRWVVALALGVLALGTPRLAAADEPLLRPVDADGQPIDPGPIVRRLVIPGIAFEAADSAGDVDAQALAARDPGRAPFPLWSPLQAWTAVTDRFGAPRGPGRLHTGIDLALATYPASTVHAACAGTVSRARWDGGYGNYVEVWCGGGWTVLTGHLSRMLVEEGEEVALGEPVGISGSTGFSTGEHVHFEVRKDGIALNPELFVDFGVDPDQPLWTGSIDEGMPEPEAAPAGIADPDESPVPEEATPTPMPPATPAESPTAAGTETPEPTPSATPGGTPSPGTARPAPPSPEGTASATATATGTGTPAIAASGQGTPTVAPTSIPAEPAGSSP